MKIRSRLLKIQKRSFSASWSHDDIMKIITLSEEPIASEKSDHKIHYSMFFGATVLRKVLNIWPYSSLGMDIGCGDQKTWNNDNMLSFAQQNLKYSLQTREKSSWKTLGGFATSGFSLGFFSRLSVNICWYRFADHSILSHYVGLWVCFWSKKYTGRRKSSNGQELLYTVA